MAAFGRGFDFIPSVMVARKGDRELKFAIGPTIATRRSVLDSIGGLESCLSRIGIDYYIGWLTSEAGFKVVLSDFWPFLCRIPPGHERRAGNRGRAAHVVYSCPQHADRQIRAE